MHKYISLLSLWSNLSWLATTLCKLQQLIPLIKVGCRGGNDEVVYWVKQSYRVVWQDRANFDNLNSI